MKIGSKNSSVFRLFCIALYLLTGHFAIVSGAKAQTVSDSIGQEYGRLLKGKDAVEISTDAAFEQTAFYFGDVLREVEAAKLTVNLQNGLQNAFDQTANALQNEKDEAAREILSNNLAYLLTAMRLLNAADNEFLVNANRRATALLVSSDLVRIANEIKLVNDSNDLAPSPILGYTEDYTQFKPRGRYEENAESQRYFRTVTWLGRLGFYTEPNSASGIDNQKANFLTASAVFLLKNLDTSKDFADYEKTLQNLVGNSDEADVFESISLLEKFFGKKLNAVSRAEILSKTSEIRAFLRSNARQPKIISTLLEEGKAAPFALRLIGQRFTPDSYVFQNLTFSSVTDFRGKNAPLTLVELSGGRKVRGFPRVFDFLSVLGNASAAEEIKRDGDDEYENYAAQTEKMKKEISALLQAENFPISYLSAVQAVNSAQKSGNNNFSVNRRQLNSAFGAYILLRHALAVYAKQSYTNLPRSMPPNLSAKMPPITVENAPLVFSNLQKAVNALTPLVSSENLANRGAKLAETLDILSKNASGKPLPNAAANEIGKRIFEWSNVKNSSIIAADLHTDLNSGQVLQSANGFPQRLSSGKNPSNKSQAVIFTVYEFRQPIAERLTDSNWREILQKNSLPGKPFFSASADKN